MNRARCGCALAAVTAATAGCGGHAAARSEVVSPAQRTRANVFCRSADQRIAAGALDGQQFLTAANLQAILAEVSGLRQLGLGGPLADALKQANDGLGDGINVDEGPQDVLADMVSAKAVAAQVGVDCSFGVQLFGG